METTYIIFFVSILLASIILFYFILKPANKKKTNSAYLDALNAMLLSDKKKAIKLLSNVVKNDSNHINAICSLKLT